MSDLVLDASAVLILLNQEAGADQVEQSMENASRAYLSAVNLAEVAAKLTETGASTNDVRTIVEALPVTIVAFGFEEAMMAGSLRRATRRSGLSLGARACLALGTALNLPVLTSDPAWTRLNLPIEVMLAR